jgi:flagellin
MTVSTIAALATGPSRAVSTQNTKASLSLGASTSASQTQTSSDTTTITYPTELQKRGGSLRVMAQSVAHAGAHLDATSAGASQISTLVSQLDGIATLASSGGLSDSQRNELDGEFQALRQQIDNAATGASFNDTPTLTGNNSVQVGGQAVTIGGLTDKDLFGENSNVNLLTAQSAQQATTAVATAQQYVSTQQATLASASADVEYAAATVESALQNQEASRSSVSDAELTSGTGTSAQSQVQANAAGALAAQTNHLPADILQLLSE